MLINLFILSSCSKTNDFCVLKSIKSNRQSSFTNAYKVCSEKNNFIIIDDFMNYIVSTTDDRISFALFGFDRNLPLSIDFSKTNVKYFDIQGGEKNQFIYFNGMKKNVTIQATRINILFEQTNISLKSATLSKSIIYSPNGKIDLFVKSLVTDGFSLKNNFFSSISCYAYKLTSRIKPTAKIHILEDKYSLYSGMQNENIPTEFNISTPKSRTHSSSGKNQAKNNSNHVRYNKYYHKIVNPNQKIEYYKNHNISEPNKEQFFENNENIQRHFIFNEDSIEYPQYLSDQFKSIINELYPLEENSGNDNVTLNSSDVKYCLCMKSRLNRCKDMLECDNYFIPLENYVTGKESWFKSDISHSVNRTIRLYITGTEGMTMNFGFEDFLGKNNTIYFNLANLNSPAYITIGGKYMSSSTSQLAVFNIVCNNINRVSINSDITSKLNDVILRKSPLFIRPSHHLTIHRLITDTKSIVSFEGTLYISEYLVLNNSIPLQLDGTLFLDEGCIVYVPQISLFPNVFINDEYILFSDEDQDNDLVLYFSEITDNSKKWTFYMSNEIIIENGQTYPSVNIYLKTSSESTIPLLFVIDIQHQGISLVFDDISKLPSSILFEVVTSNNDNKSHFLELQIDYTDEPKNILFKQITGNIDLVLLTSKTIQYFLGNENPTSCFNQTNPGPECNGINLFGLNSLTFYVYYSMTKIGFRDDSIDIYFDSDSISFSTSLTNFIQVIAELEMELQMTIVPGSAKLFPLSLVVINNNSVINFDDTFSYIVDSNDPDEMKIVNHIYIFHEELNIDLISSHISKIPEVSLDNSISGVLFNTSSDSTYKIYRSTNFVQNSYRSGPKVTVNIAEDNVTVPQGSFLANDVQFTGRPFIFTIQTKSRCNYIFDNEVRIKIYEDLAVSSNRSSTNDNFDGFHSKNKSVRSSFSADPKFNEIELLNFSENNSDSIGVTKYEFNSNSLRLLDEPLTHTNVVDIHGLFFSETGKMSQNEVINLFVDTIECRTVSSIDESNFVGPINVFSSFVLNDVDVDVIELSNDSARITNTNRNSAFLRQADQEASFEVIYERNSRLLKSSSPPQKVITLKVLNKETEILKNFTLLVNSPATIFFDSTWYNVTNPDDLRIIATKDIKVQTELVKMPNFTVMMLDKAVETVEIKKPKHTSTIAFYTFLALAIVVFIFCIIFCVIDFFCILKPKSVEIDLSSSSSDRSLEDLPFSSVSSSYEYYTVEEDEVDNDNDNKDRDIITINSPVRANSESQIIITAYGNTTAEWKAEHMRKRRKRPKNELILEEEEDYIDGGKKKRKKSHKKIKKKKQNEKEFIGDESDRFTLEELYYDDNS